MARRNLDDGELELLTEGVSRLIAVERISDLDDFAPECAIRFIAFGWMATKVEKGRVYVTTTVDGAREVDRAARARKGRP